MPAKSESLLQCEMKNKMGLPLMFFFFFFFLFFPAYRCWKVDKLFIRRHPNKDLKWTKLCFGPIYTHPETFLGFLEQTTMKADPKLTVIMCCLISDRRSVAPSSGDFRRRPPAPRRPWCDKSPNVWQCGITHFVWSKTVMS